MIKNLSRLAAVSAVALLAGATGALANTSSYHTQTTTAQTTTYHTNQVYHSAAVSDPSDHLYSPLTGLYVGAYGGYDFAHLQNDGVGNGHLRGADYGGFVGYSLDALLDRYSSIGLTGAIEGHYGYSNARDHVTAGGVSVSQRKRNEWGFDFRPGLAIIDETVAPVGIKPYAIVGYDRTKFSTSAGGVGGSTHHNGFAIGAGTELFTVYHVGIRADYEHVFYQKNDGIDPSENQIRLGAALHF